MHIDLSNGRIIEKPITKEMKEKFTGDRGFDLWLLWQALPRDRVARWDDFEQPFLKDGIFQV